MTIQYLSKQIALIEGKKSQARIGDIREILKILTDINAQACVSMTMDSELTPLELLQEISNKKLEKLRNKTANKK